MPVPIRGVISDGQQTIRQAVALCLPGMPHQLCHFHYLDEAAGPIFEADRHAKTELKKLVRGVRPIERSLEGGESTQIDAMRSYCLAVRSALTDDGHPPLCASGLKLHDRLTQIADSLARVEEKRGALPPYDASVSYREHWSWTISMRGTACVSNSPFGARRVASSCASAKTPRLIWLHWRRSFSRQACHPRFF